MAYRGLARAPRIPWSLLRYPSHGRPIVRWLNLNHVNRGEQLQREVSCFGHKCFTPLLVTYEPLCGPALTQGFSLEIELPPLTQRALEGAALELTMDVASAEDDAMCVITELESSEDGDEASDKGPYASGRGRRLRQLAQSDALGASNRRPGFDGGPEASDLGAPLRQLARFDALYACNQWSRF